MSVAITGLFVGLIVLIAPAAVIGLGSVAVAARLGWPWGRIRNLAIGSLILFVGPMIQARNPFGPVIFYFDGVHAAMAHHWVAGVLDSAGVTVPLGFVIGAWMWGRHLYRVQAGMAGNLMQGERFVEGLWNARWRRAYQLARYPYPLTDKRGGLVLGPLVEETEGVPRGQLSELLARHPRRLTVPYQATREHMVMVADTGAGKTTTLRRVSAGWTEAAWQLHMAGFCGRPLVVWMDCKSGPGALDEGAAWQDQLIGMGLPERRVGLWPLCDRLDMWQMHPKDLTATLFALVPPATEQYWNTMRLALLGLVCEPPTGPAPESSPDLLSRFDPRWLKDTYHGRAEMTQVDEIVRAKVLGTAAAQYGQLFRSLGTSLDAGRTLDDFDGLYAAVAGTRRPEEARAQAAAVVQMVVDLLASDHQQGRPPREVLLIADEYSAVSGSGGVGLVGLVERMRSLGGSVIACAQSWQGLGETDDERRRLVAACSGGRLLMRSTAAEDMAKLSGTQRRPEPSRHMNTRRGHLDEGQARMQDTFLVPPQRVREMRRGDLVVAAKGRATWGHVVAVPRRPQVSRVLTVAPDRDRPVVGDRIGPLELANDLDEQLEDLNAYLGRDGGERA